MVTKPSLNDSSWVVRGTGETGAGLADGDEILLQNILSDDVYLLQQTDGAITSQVALPTVSDANAVAFADFDGDGIDDVFYRSDDGSNDIFLSSTGLLTSTNSAFVNWQVAASADLTGDGTDDIILRNVVDGRVTVWEMNNGVVQSSATFAPTFTVSDSLLATYDGTDKDTFSALWFDVSANQYQMVSHDNGAMTLNDVFTVTAGQLFQTSGDFNGDGNTDFQFLDTAGSNAGSAEVIFANQFNLESARFAYQAGTSAFGTQFGFDLAGDFDGDGIEELARIDDATGDLIVYDVTGAITGISTETLSGSDANDAINGNFGNDRILGHAGDDLLIGDGNNDVLLGQLGRDFLFGGDDEDALFGGEGDDEIDTGAGMDVSSGGQGNDLIFSHQGSGNGSSFADGNDGDDYLLTGEGGHLRGGPGNDLLQSISNNAVLEGNDGDDYLMGSGSSDRLFGGNDNDFLLGDAGQDTLFGGNGDDILIGNTRTGSSISTDTFYGGSGRDYFYLGNGDVGFYEGTGAAVISDLSTSVTSGDFIMLEGSQSQFTFTDTGSTIEIDVAATANLVAIIETSATIAQVQEVIIYI